MFLESEADLAVDLSVLELVHTQDPVPEEWKSHPQIDFLAHQRCGRAHDVARKSRAKFLDVHITSEESKF